MEHGGNAVTQVAIKPTVLLNVKEFVPVLIAMHCGISCGQEEECSVTFRQYTIFLSE